MPGIPNGNWSNEKMIESVQIVGARGRVGSAVSARLAERGVVLDAATPELVLLCVPDRAIAEVAAATPLGPWIAHVSGATPLDALDPHVRRFGLHPLQSFSKDLGPEQLDGVWGAVTAESEEARAVGRPARRDPRRCVRSTSTTTDAPPTTRAPRWPRTTSSPFEPRRSRCSRRRVHLPRRSIR